MPNSVKFALLIMVVTVIYGEILESRRELRSVPPLRRPPPEAAPPKLPDMMPEGRGRLRRPSLQDPAITIVADGKNTHSVSTGTAFSIDDNGVWITARHVTDGCDKLFVLVNSRGGYKVDFVSQHPTADVSLLKTANGAKALPISTEDLDYNQEGFHFGFPRGEPGANYARLVGRRVMKTQGRRSARENVLVWAEKVRIPESDLPLGGLSGGPALDAQGNVVGVMVAASLRRGRSYSSLPKTIHHLVNRNNMTLPDVPQEPELAKNLTIQDFAQAAAMLRKRLSVAKVVCLVE